MPVRQRSTADIMPVSTTPTAANAMGQLVHNATQRNAEAMGPFATVGNAINDFNYRVGNWIDNGFDKFVTNKFKDKEKAKRWADRYDGADLALVPDILEDVGIMAATGMLAPELGIALLMGKAGLQNAENFQEAISGVDNESGQALSNKQRAAKGAGAAINTLIYGIPMPLGRAASALKKAGNKTATETAEKTSNAIVNKYNELLGKEAAEAAEKGVTEEAVEQNTKQATKEAVENAAKKAAPEVSNEASQKVTAEQAAATVAASTDAARQQAGQNLANEIAQEAPTQFEQALSAARSNYRPSPYEIDYAVPRVGGIETSGGVRIPAEGITLSDRTVLYPPKSMKPSGYAPNSISPIEARDVSSSLTLAKDGRKIIRQMPATYNAGLHKSSGPAWRRYSIEPEDYALSLIPEGAAQRDVIKLGNEWRAARGMDQVPLELTAEEIPWQTKIPPISNNVEAAEAIVSDATGAAKAIPGVRNTIDNLTLRGTENAALESGSRKLPPSAKQNAENVVSRGTAQAPEIHSLDEIITDRAVLDQVLTSAEATEAWRAEQKIAIQDFLNRARVQLGESSPEFAQLKNAAQQKWHDVEYIANGYRMQNNMGNAMGGFVSALGNQGVRIPGVSPEISETREVLDELIGQGAKAGNKSTAAVPKDATKQVPAAKKAANATEKEAEQAAEEIIKDVQQEMTEKEFVETVVNMFRQRGNFSEAALWNDKAFAEEMMKEMNLSPKEMAILKSNGQWEKWTNRIRQHKAWREAVKAEKIAQKEATKSVPRTQRAIAKLTEAGPRALAYAGVPALALGSGMLNAYGENGPTADAEVMYGGNDNSYRSVAGPALALMLAGPRASRYMGRAASGFSSGTYNALRSIMKDNPDIFGKLYTGKQLGKVTGTGVGAMMAPSLISATGTSTSDTKYKQ